MIHFTGAIYYVHEALFLSNSSMQLAQRLDLVEFCSTCSNATSYGVTFWIKKLDWYDTYGLILRLSNDPTYSK